MGELPTGTVTFLFTDIEGSTRMLSRLGPRFHDVVETHGRLLREAIAAGGGTEVHTEGDSFFAAFPTPAGAIRAAVQAQRTLAAAPWPEDEAVRVRMGLHTGEGVPGGDDYVGLDVHRAARIAAAGHGGQILVSDATRGLVEQALPEGTTLRDLGTHRLKDLEHPEHLHQLIVDGLLSEFPAIRALKARPTNLPPQRSSFVGRGYEVAEISSLLDDVRLVTLTGPGGTGKTRLALRVAADRLDHFGDGVFFVDLSAIAEAGIVPSAIAGALRVREEPGRDLLDSLADHLGDREMLLVLDNFEQVIDAAPVVDRLLARAPRVAVLATSRVPLHLSGEHEFAVSPLGLPDLARVGDLEALTQYEAVALFIERASAVRRDFRVTNENAPAVAEITARLEGLPLAIELAARRVKVLTPEALLARLGQRLPLLTGGARDLPERHRTLRGAIEWSHELLEPDEQRLLARLSVFAGGWALESAEAVSAPGLETDVLEGVGSLVDKSLVRQEETSVGGMRFRMLETIREFAAERLADSGERDEIRRRLAEHLRDLAEEAEPHFIGGEQVRWLDRFEQEHDNLRAALTWAEEADEAESGLRTAAAVWRFWQQRGHLAEGRQRLERLLALPSARARDAVRARALIAFGSLAYWQNDYGPTEAAYEEAAGIARALDDGWLQASAIFNLHFVPLLNKDYERAESLLDESLSLARQTGDRRLLSEVMAATGFLEVFRGNPARAIQPMEEAIAIQRELGERFLVADNLTGLAAVQRLAGNVPAAIGHLREALRMFVEAGDVVSIPGTLEALSIASGEQGRYERAARLAAASSRMREEVGGGAPPELMHRLGTPDEGAREALGDDAYERAGTEGRAMTTDEAVAYALDESE